MDEYGSFGHNSNDYKDLRMALDAQGAITFSWSPNQIDVYVVCITKRFQKLGVMPFGGNPTGACMVAVLLRGAFWFDLDANQDTIEEYAEEKLGAADLALLINGLRRQK